MLFKNFPRRLKELRKIKDLSQRDLAKNADISPSYVASLETGSVEPTLRVAQKIADALNVDIKFFMEKEDEPIPLLNFVSHFPNEVRSFLEKEESVSWLTLSKDFADQGLSPEDIKELADIILKHKKLSK